MFMSIFKNGVPIYLLIDNNKTAAASIYHYLLKFESNI